MTLFWVDYNIGRIFTVLPDVAYNISNMKSGYQFLGGYNEKIIINFYRTYFHCYADRLHDIYTRNE